MAEMTRCFRTLAVVVALIAAIVLPQHAQAAEVTDVLDAFDFEHDNPYDVSLRLRFGQDSRDAVIAREVRCLSQDQVGAQYCASGSKTVYAREMTFSRKRQSFFIDARVGVHHDVELYATFPIVISDSWSHDFVDGVGHKNSTLHPPNDAAAVFAIPYKSTDRSGFGDMTMGLKWSPYNYYRDPAHPTWVLGVQYTAPTGTVMKADNDGVGLGMHDLHFFTTISRRALGMIEPFFNIHGTLRFGAADSLFTNRGPTQVRSTPGSVIGTQFGTEIIPWEDVKEDARVELEFGFRMDYVFRGREYTEIWEALASPDNPCQLDKGCTNTLHTKSEVDPATLQHTRTDGVTDVEQYGQFTGWASLHYQPIRYFQLSAAFQYAVDTPHFITFGDYGKDRDGKGGVQQANSADPPQNEYSPTFLPALDAPGNRLRLQDASTWTLILAVSGKL